MQETGSKPGRRKRMVIVVAVVGVLAALIFWLAGGIDRIVAWRAFSKLQREVDVVRLNDWGQRIVTAKAPREAFTNSGAAIPKEFLKHGAVPPVAQLFDFRDGDSIIALNASFGSWAFSGICLAKTNAFFPGGYRVYELRPGIYYFVASN